MLNFRFVAPTAAPKSPSHLDNFLVLLGVDHFSIPAGHPAIFRSWGWSEASQYKYDRELLKDRHEFWEKVRITHENVFVAFKRKLEDELREPLAIAADFALLDYENMYNKNQ